MAVTALALLLPLLCSARVSQPEQKADEERALVEAAQGGDDAALRALLTRFSRPLYSAVILPRIGVRSEADEILALTLERVALRIDDFRYTKERGVWPWLTQIATNAIIDWARRQASRTSAEERYGAEIVALSPRAIRELEAVLIEEEERRERTQRLHAALQQLNERYRCAIELRIFEEKSRQECAAELGVTVATFDVLLHRALGALKKTFGPLT